MGALRLSTGVYIPNHDFRRKTTGGRVGIPDGWIATTTLNNEIGTGVVKMRWETMNPGMGDRAIPYWPYGSGRCMTMEVAAGSPIGVEREVWSPYSPAGHHFGAEQMNLDGRGYWYYRLSAIVFGKRIGGLTASPQAVSVGFDIHNVELNRHRRTAIATLQESGFDGAWRVIQSSVDICDTNGWTPGPGSTTPGFSQVFVGVPGGASTQTCIVGVADVVVETLGPVDQGEQAGTLHAGTPPNTYYELSKTPLYQGMRPYRRTSMVKQDVLPSGRLRSFDPSGGVHPASFEFPHDVLTRNDFLKLSRLWNANRGVGSNGDTWYGRPLPLVIQPNQPDLNYVIPGPGGGTKIPARFYADFANEEFPLEPTGSWQRSDEAGQLYRGNLKFRGR